MRYLALLIALPLAAVPAANLAAQEYVLSDYPAGFAQASGWVWEAFADRVMGGKSELVPPLVANTADGPALRLAGKVITKGGGFIQIRLRHEGGLFDASGFAGVELTAEAAPGGRYFVFLRTKDNFFPWSYYAAPLDFTGGKLSFRLPWSAFEAESTGRKTVRPRYLSSIAMTAAFLDFNADLKIYRVSLFK